MDINLITEDQLARLSQLISSANTILITCHKSPDGDAIGASLGWAEYLRTIGKDPVVIVPDQYPDFLKWMPNTEKIVRYDKHRDKADMLFKIADLVFCLDYNTPSRVEDMEPALLSASAPKVLIDHHLSPDVPAELTISEPEASSTCELVFRLVWQLGGFPQMGKAFAVPIYCGMMTDTGGFTYNSSHPEIYAYVMYEKLVYLPQYHAAYYTLTREELQRFHFVKGDAEGLVNIPQQIKGLKLSISLREDTEKDHLIWVSLRSVDDFPANQVAEQFFNGGGHLNAAGGRLNGTIDEAIATINKALKAFASSLQD